MKVAIGCDHAGFQFKQEIIKYLLQRNIEVTDKGSHSAESVDYPDYVHPVARDIEAERVDLGILICGSGNGVAMTANKYPHVRCGVCWEVTLAELARKHNNANVVALPARFIDLEAATNIVNAFLNTSFEGERHERRVQKIIPDHGDICR